MHRVSRQHDPPVMPMLQDTFNGDEWSTVTLIPKLATYHGWSYWMVSHAGSQGFSISICITLSLWPGKGLLEAKEDEEKHVVGLCQDQERISCVVYHGHVALAQFWKGLPTPLAPMVPLHPRSVFSASWSVYGHCRCRRAERRKAREACCRKSSLILIRMADSDYHE